MTPMAPLSACLTPRCPAFAVDRGRCQAHRRTTTQRSYGIVHQRERAAALPGARCERCGCDGGPARHLQRDHRVPASMGGDESATNKRWLCRGRGDHACHDLIGLRIDRQSRDWP